MFKRRSLVAGGLSLAAMPALVLPASAQASKPVLVFVGHEL